MNTEKIQIERLKLNAANPRTIKDEKFKKLIKSIREFPQMLEIRPIVVDNDMTVLGGNMRLRACIEAGLTHVPVIRASELTDEQKQRFIIADNVGFGDWDWEALANEWDAGDLDAWGLDVPEGSFGAPKEAEEDDYEIPDEIQTDIVLGDLFEIGPHRLLCGDSTDSDQVAKLMNGEKSELLFTSPPYSDMRDYNGNKDLSEDNLVNFLTAFSPHCNYIAVNLGIQFKNAEIVPYWDKYTKKANDIGLKMLAWNVWDKTIGGSIASATNMFLLTHEWIFVFGSERKKLNRTIPNQVEKYAQRHGENWHNGQSGKSIRKKDGTMDKTSSKTYLSHQLHSVIQHTPELGKIREKHPATFPVGLPSEYIKAMTNEVDIVSEPFTGSGTTMVAAHQLDRRCYGMELDPKYCQVIIDRMLKLDPDIEIKRNGQPYLINNE